MGNVHLSAVYFSGNHITCKETFKLMYLWQKLLDVKESDETEYHNYVNVGLAEMFTQAPKRLLDIGCASGGFAEYVKGKHPDVYTIGVELNEASAQIASNKMDQVFGQRFEDISDDESGIHPASIDTVIMSDVLEHMYNPWQTMVRLKRFLTDDGKVYMSIPNTRNINLINSLVNGCWSYESQGLLDITHIRFFTLQEIRRFLKETGYQIEEIRNTIDPRLGDFCNQFPNQPKTDIKLEKLVLRDVTKQEMNEFCTLQFLVCASPIKD